MFSLSLPVLRGHALAALVSACLFLFVGAAPLSAQTYCSANGSGPLWIQSAEVAVGNQPGVTTDDFFSNGNNYTNELVGTVGPFSRGETLYLQLSTTAGASGTTYYRFYVDINADGDFTDSDELVYDTSFAVATANTGSTFSTFWTIPPTANSPLRIRLMASTNVALTSPCQTGYGGEYWDYTANLNANTAPTFSGGDYVLPDSLVNDTTQGGFPLNSIIDYTNDVSDADTSARKGVAIIGQSGASGTWQWSNNNGSSWNNLTGLSSSNAFLFSDSGSNWIRFVGTAVGNASLTVRAWDETQGTEFSYFNIGSTGGTTAFSTATDIIEATVWDDSAVPASPAFYTMDSFQDAILIHKWDPATGTVYPGRTHKTVVDGVSLALDEANGFFYWRTGSFNIERTAQSGSGAIDVLYTQNGNFYGTAVDIDAGSGSLRYVVQEFSSTPVGNTLYRASLTSPNSTTTSSISSADTIWSMEWDGTYNFFGQDDAVGYRILRTNSTGGSGFQLSPDTGSAIDDFAENGGVLYWVESGNARIRSIAKNSGTTSTLLNTTGAAATLEIDAGNGFIYYATHDPWALWRADFPGGGNITRLLTLQGIPRGIAFEAPPVNSPPEFDDADDAVAFAVGEDSILISLNSFLAVTDTDSGDTLTWTISSAPNQGGTIGTGGTQLSTGTSVSPSGFSYTPAANFSGTETFSIQVSDGTANDTIAFTVTVNDAPEVSSIFLADSNPTNADSLDFTVTFTTSVSGVDSGDFSVSGSTATVTGVSGSGTTYTVTVSGGDLAGLNGAVRLDLGDNDTITAGGGPLGGVGTSGAGDGSFTTGPSYTVDNIAPTVQSVVRKTPSGTWIPGGNVTFTITFSEELDAFALVLSDFSLVSTGGGSSPNASTINVTSTGGNPTVLDVTFDTTGMNEGTLSVQF